jgi:P-type Ca2+ transporter type 2C
LDLSEGSYGTLTTIELKVTNPLAHPSNENSNDVVAEFVANAITGLSAAEATTRLTKNGANTLRSAPIVPKWRRLLGHFHDPLIYLLLIAIVVALVAWALEGRVGLPIDAIVIAAVVLLNGGFGYLQAGKAASAVAALAKMTQVTSAVLRNGQPIRVPSSELVLGDILLLGEGDAVGADARLIEAASLHIQEASLTGESESVLKNIATLPQPVVIADQLNMVFKGTAVTQGTGRAVVTATGMQTQMGLIAALLESTPVVLTPLQKEVGQLGKNLAVAVVAIAVIVVAVTLLTSNIRTAAEFVTVLLLGVSLAVAAVPEGLPAILSVVLALGVQRMAKHNAIVKNLSSVETLGSATVICTDKTGTLTRAEMTIERILTASGDTTVSGIGYSPDGDIRHKGSALSPGPLQAEQIAVLGGGSLANNAEFRQNHSGEWEIHGDPTEAAFLVAERKLGIEGATARREHRFERIAEIPFTSERKMMSTIEIDHEQNDQLVLITKGAPGVVLESCTKMRVGLDTVDLNDILRQQKLQEIDSLADAALRTLAVAYRPLAKDEGKDQAAALEHDLIFIGTVGFIDPPREEAKTAIEQAHHAGIRVIMITGDHPRTAQRIALDLGIVQASGNESKIALTGLELDALTDADFDKSVKNTSVFARVTPAHKLRIVSALQADGNIVAMTGDGVNDSPALKLANIGVAMGITGTEVTKEAAKMILADDNFATMIEAVREGRAILDNIRKFLRYLLCSNMGEVLTVFLGVIGASVIGLKAEGDTVALPLLATQLLWINLITDSGPALAMGIDPPNPDLMTRKPRQLSDRLIDKAMWLDVIQTGFVIAIASLLAIDLYLPGGLIEGEGNFTTARTAGFTVLVLASMFTCFTSRSESASAFIGFFTNHWLVAAVALSLALQVAVVNVPFLNTAFSTAPLTINQWLVCFLMASSVLWFSELRKIAIRVRDTAHAHRTP